MPSSPPSLAAASSFSSKNIPPPSPVNGTSEWLAVSHAAQPLPPPSKRETEFKFKQKQKVLDEETYGQQLEQIIQRDFFPDLPYLRRQLDPSAAATAAASNDAPDMSLDAFQSTHVSQDHANFQQVLHQQRQQQQHVYTRLHPQLLPGPVDSRSDHDVNRWTVPVKNRLLFPVDASSSASASIAASSSLQLRGRGEPKSIQHASTRFPDAEGRVELVEDSSLALPSSSHHGSFSSTAAGGLGENSTPATMAYSYVQSTPLIHPDQATPQLTWGSVSQTPLRLESPSTSFKVPALPKREALAQRLADRNRSQAKEKTSKRQWSPAMRDWVHRATLQQRQRQQWTERKGTASPIGVRSRSQTPLRRTEEEEEAAAE